jgi:predicted RNase H-like HicB family nuclease
VQHGGTNVPLLAQRPCHVDVERRAAARELVGQCRKVHPARLALRLGRPAHRIADRGDLIGHWRAGRRSEPERPSRQHVELHVHTVTVPALPGVVTQRDTVKQCIERAEEAIALHLAAMVEDGEPIPEEHEKPLLISVTVAA